MRALPLARDYLVGVRMSAVDFNYLPVNLRLPDRVSAAALLLRQHADRDARLWAASLAKLGVDFLHITSGFGFIHPGESPGAWPVDEFRLYANATRHLSAKAKFRADRAQRCCPRPLATALFGHRLALPPDANLDYARAFKEATGLPVIANGGFEIKDELETALASRTNAI